MVLALSAWADVRRVGGSTARRPLLRETPVFGAWRNLQTEAGHVPAQRDLAFAMLPQAATRGDRFAIVDREASARCAACR